MQSYISIQLCDMDSNPLDITSNNINSINIDDDCKIIFTVGTSSFATFQTSIEDLYHLFASKYNTNTQVQNFTFVNSNGDIGIYKKNNMLDFCVSKYGCDSDAEIHISVPTDQQINTLIQNISDVYDFLLNKN